MTNSQPQPNKPSAKFLQTLKEMSKERGVNFVPPSTTAEARIQYRDLKAIPRLDLIQKLKRMSRDRDITFVLPSTAVEARTQYRALKAAPRVDPIDRRLEDKAIRDEVATGTNGLSFRDDELGGYGSSAHWSARG